MIYGTEVPKVVYDIAKCKRRGRRYHRLRERIRIVWRLSNIWSRSLRSFETAISIGDRGLAFTGDDLDGLARAEHSKAVKRGDMQYRLAMTVMASALLSADQKLIHRILRC